MKKFVDNYNNEEKVCDKERLERWNICSVCSNLDGEFIGALGFKEPDDKRKNCTEEGTTAFWFTQFKDAKCPIGKW
jgi:hypothetical protein